MAKFITIASVLATAASVMTIANGQKIDLITPRLGSVLGGTRVTILGSGFDIRGRSNDVYIGDDELGGFCDPVPNECHTTRIICLTPALKANGAMPIQVISFGNVAACNYESGAGCSFTFTADRTPIVTALKPQWVSQPSPVTVTGSAFDRGDLTVGAFDFAAWFGDEERCDLGANDVSASSFVCTVMNGIFPGANRLSLQLGTRGYARVNDDVSLTVIPSITAVSATEGSTEGGQIVTIAGNFFSRTAVENTVTIHGAPCVPTSATPEQIVCVTTAHEPTTTAPAPSYTEGVQFDFWGRGTAAEPTAESLRGSLAYFEPTVSMVTSNFGGALPVPSENQAGARYTAWYVAPQTGEYQISAYIDDGGELWVGRDENPVEFVRNQFSDDLTYNDRLIVYRGTTGTSTGNVTLEAGKRYWMQLFTVNIGGPISSTVTFTLPDGTSVVNPSSGMTVPNRAWESPVVAKSRGVRAIYGTSCVSYGSCDFNYATASTPVVTAVSPASGAAGTAITITGTSLTANANIAKVTIGDKVCAVTSASLTQIVCTVPASLAAGTHPVGLTIVGAGRARITATFTASFAITSVTNANGYVAISGTGFNVDPARITVTLAGNSPCTGVTVVDGEIRCAPDAALPSGTTSVDVAIADSFAAVAPLSFKFDQVNERPGTTTAPKPATLFTKTGALFVRNVIVMNVPAWTIEDKATVSATFGEEDCEITMAQGSIIQCLSPAVYTAGAYEVAVASSGSESVTVGTVDIAQTVTSVSVNHLSSLGGNVVDIFHTGTNMDVDAINDGSLNVTYRGIPCKAAERRAFTTIRCYVDDRSFSANPALPVLDSFKSSTENVLQSLQTTGAVTINPTGFFIPAGATLFTRRSYSQNIRVTAEVTPSQSTSKCIRMTALSADPSYTQNGMVGIAYGSSFTVARGGWTPAAVAGPEGLELTAGVKSTWRLEVSSGYGALYIDGNLVANLNAAPLQSGIVGFGISCQDITVENLKIEDLTPATMQIAVNGSPVAMFDEPITKDPTLLVISGSSAMGAPGDTFRMRIASSVASAIYAFPAGTTDFQLTPDTPMLCTSGTTQSVDAVTKVITASCIISDSIPAGSYILRFRQADNGFIATQVNFLVEPVVTAIAPTKPSMHGALLTITGKGLSEAIRADLAVTAGGASCPIVGVSLRAIVCRLAAGEAGATKDVEVTYKGERIGAGKITYLSYVESPRLISITNQLKGGNDHITVNGANLGGPNSVNAFAIVDGKMCTVGWGSASSFVCRFRGELPSVGTHAVTYHASGLGYAETNANAVMVIAKGFNGVAAFGSNGGATVTVNGLKFAPDAGFTTAASFDFTTGNLENSKWSVSRGQMPTESFTCGTFKGFGGVSRFGKFTSITREAITLAPHANLAISVELVANGLDSLPIQVTVDGVVYNFSPEQTLRVLKDDGLSIICETGTTTRSSTLLQRTFVIPHTASTAVISIAVPTYWTGSYWFLRSYAVKTGTLANAVTIGSAPCPITFAEPHGLVCTAPALAAGDYAVAVTESGSALTCIASNSACTATVNDANVVVNSASYASIAGTAAGFNWGSLVRATGVNTPTPRITADSNIGSGNWNAAGASQQLYFKQDGFNGLTASLGGTVMIGVATGPVSASDSYVDLDFAFYRSASGTYTGYELGAWQFEVSAVANAKITLRIEEDDTVTYLIENTIVYRSSRKVQWPLRIDASLASNGAFAQIDSINFKPKSPAYAFVPVILSGENIPATGVVSATVSGSAVTILRQSANFIAVAVPANFATPGASLDVSLQTAAGSFTGSVVLSPSVTSISQSKGTTVGNHLVTVVGSGFTSAPTVLIGTITCTVQSYTFNSIVCLTGASVAVDNLPVSVTVGSAAAQCLSSVDLVAQPALKTTCPTYSYGASTITVTGATFANNLVNFAGTGFTLGDSATVIVGSTMCTQTSITETTVTCALPATFPGGSYNAILSFGFAGGSAAQTLVIPVTAAVSVNAIGNLGGARITVTGNGFGTAATLKSGGSSVCASTESQTGTSFVCVTAPGDFTSVVAANDNGVESSAVSLVANAANRPTITSVSPAVIAAFSPLTLTGTGFSNVVSVDISGSQCVVLSQTSTTVVCRPEAVPSGAIAVTIASSDRGASAAIAATSMMAVAGVQSGKGKAGETVTILGSGFSAVGTYTASVGQYPCTSCTYASAAALSCVLTGPAEFVDKVLDTTVTYAATDATTKTTSYSHVQVVNPTITSISPAFGSKAGGTVITIVGTGFDNNPQNNIVTVGGARCMTIASAATELTCETSAIVAGASGNVDVSVTTKGLPSTNTVSFLATFAVTAITPSTPISVEGGVTITIAGAGFPTAEDFKKPLVTVGGIPCEVESTSATEIVCAVGASPRPSSNKITDLYQSYPPRSDNTAVVRVIVNNTIADIDDNAITVQFMTSATPTITSAASSSATIYQGTAITITGNGFAASGNVVELLNQGLNGGRSNCVVTSETTTSIVCTADLVTFGKHFVQVKVPGVGYAATQKQCALGEFLTCDGQCLNPVKDCSYTEWGIFSDCTTLLSVLAGDVFCHSNGGSDRVNGKFKVDSGKILDLNCPMYSCEARDCNTTITIGGKGEIVSTCGVDPNGMVVEARARITAIAGSKVSSIYGGARFVLTGSNLDLDSVFVIGGGAYCVPISVDGNTVTCETVAVKTAATDLKLVGTAHGTPIDCTDSVCGGFSFVSTDIPVITGITPLRADSRIEYQANAAITIAGSGFSATAAENVITAGGFPCAVTSATTSQIICTPAALPVGDYAIAVRAPVGLAAPFATRARVYPVIATMSSTTSSTLGGNTITVTGSGLSSENGVATYTPRGCTAATVISASLTEVVIVTPECAASSARTLDINVDGKSSTCRATSCNIAFVAARTATANIVSANTVEISSTFALDDVTVKVGNGVCTIISNTANTLQCDTPATHAAGSYPVVLVQANFGRYELTGSIATKTYAGSITSISPSTGSLGGAQTVTITGTGFATDAAEMSVKVAGAFCDVTAATATQIVCTTSASAATSGAVTIDLKAPVGSGALSGATYTYSDANTPTLTSVSPNRGSTAGGTMLTIVGTRLSNNIAVTINGVVCTQTAAEQAATTSTTYYCTTGALATSRAAVLRAVDVNNGAAANTLEYDYIDLWSRWTTWGNTPPPQYGDSAVISEGQTIMMDYNAPRLHLILVMGHLMFDDTKDITLEATYIMINFGRFTIGTPEKPYVFNAVIRLFGDRLTPEIPVHGAKVLALRHGALDMHGIPRHPTFTKLAATAPAMATTIKVRGPVDWKIGEEIVITTTDFKMEHSEPRVITSVADATTDVVTIGINEPLFYGHNGQKECFDNNKVCIEEIADVMLLTRNIKVVGDNRTQSLGFGGTMFLMPMGHNDTMYARLSYVEFADVGQQYIVGRYPVHFHVAGVLNNSYVKGNSVHRSLNRAFSIHGVSNNTYVDNVAYDVQGHAFFIEDGDEAYNNITHNLVALVHTSTSNLNTDLTPACFWCVSTKNILNNNIAAGAAAYGFWISPFHPHSTGPGFSEKVCPAYHPIVSFNKNEAHSNKKYGLNIFQFLWPKEKECDANGPDFPGVINNFFSWKNKIHGVTMAHSEVGSIGAVTFDNLVSANNGEDHIDASAFWVEHIKAENMTFGIRGAVLIGQTSNAPHISVHTRRGINLPLGDNFFAQDVKFINYEGQNFGIEPQRWANRMSFCFPWGWEALFRRTSWVNAPNKMRMRFVHHGIINDEDGTFGSGTPNTQIIPQSSLLDPVLCPFVAGSPIVPTAACTSEHKLRRFGVVGVNEVFADQLFKVDDREEIVPQITRKYSMSVPANKIVNIEFQAAYNPSKFNWNANDRFRQPGEKNIFQTLYKEVREVANATFDGVRAEMMNRRPTLSDTVNGYYFGEKVFTALVIAPTTGVVADASTCPWEGCPIEPLESAALGGPCTAWENPAAWVNGQVPADGAALRVNYTESICLSIPGKVYRLRSLYLGGKIEVNSTFCKAGQKITLYVEKFIHIRGGILQAGSAENPLECEFEIIVGPVDFDNMGASTIVPWSARSIVLESGDIAMFGAEKTRVAYLRSTSSAGSTVLNLDRDVNWKVGDSIVVAGTRRDAPYTGTHRVEESEEFTISAINGRTVTLSAPLAFSHFGTAPQTLNGATYDIGAEVVCLSRTVKITGGHKKGDKLQWNLGWNFHVGCTSKILAGCGDGDARLVGFPMGPLKPGSVRMQNVQMDDIGQEGGIHAALVFDGLVTSKTELSARTSYLRGCTFNRVRAIGINIHSSTRQLELSNNILFNVDGDGIRVGGKENIIEGNIIIKNSFVKPLCKKMYHATVKPDCVGGAFRINAGNTVRNNIAASGDGIGFQTTGEACGTPFNWAGNIATRHQDGLLINDVLASGGTPEYHWDYTPHSCRVAGGVHAFSNTDQGVAVWYAVGDVTVRDVVVADNMFGVTALLYKDSFDRGDTQLQYVLEDSTIAGHWTTGQPCAAENAFICRMTMVDSMEWCSTIYNAQMGKRIRGAGVLETVFVDNSYAGRNKGESMFMWIEPDSYTTVKGRAQIRNVHFENFAGVNDCDQREVAFFQNFFSNDTFHQHTFEGITWGPNVPESGKFYYWGSYGDAKGTLTEDKQAVFLDYDDTKRGGFWPDAPHKVWLIDTDGSFTGTNKLQTIFGSRTIARTATFDQLKYDGRAFRNGGAPGALKPGCIFVDSWQAYQCENKKYVSLTIESLADDTLTRRSGPLVMCKGDGMIGPNGHPLCQGGEADYASGPVMKGKEQRATLDRLSRYRFTVEVGHNYTLSTRGAPPVWIRMWLHGHEYTGLSLEQIGVVVNMRYFGLNSRMRVGVYVDGVRKPLSFGFGSPYTIENPTTFPMPTDPAGTHYHNLGFFDTEVNSGLDTKQYNIMSTTLKPNSYVDWKQESIIIITSTVAMTEEDFFNNKAAFALALASTLGIPESRLKFANIVAGTYGARRKLLASSTTAEFMIGVDEALLNAGADQSNFRIKDDLKDILERINNLTASGTTTIGGFPISSISGETVVPKVEVPAPLVTSQYNFMVFNVSRDDGLEVNHTFFTEHVLNYANTQLAPASGILRTLTREDIATGGIWNFYADAKTRMTMFFALDDDHTNSNLLTSNLHEVFMSPSHARYAIPANYLITDITFVRQADSESEKSLAAGFIILIVIGCLVVVGLLVAAIAYVLYQRRKAAAGDANGERDAIAAKGLEMKQMKHANVASDSHAPAGMYEMGDVEAEANGGEYNYSA